MSSAGEEVLITGQSGTGQSNLIANLAALSFKAVDTDDGRCEPQPDGRQRWREDAIQELLATEDTGVVFVAGCEENQVKFHPWFDHIILLSAPAEVLTRRLATRTNNPFGNSAGDYHRFLADLAVNAPHLVALVRAGATFINGKPVERPGGNAEPGPGHQGASR